MQQLDRLLTRIENNGQQNSHVLIVKNFFSMTFEKERATIFVARPPIDSSIAR